MAYPEILNYTRKFLEYMSGSNFSDACPKMLVDLGILEVSKEGWRIKAGEVTITRGLLMSEEKIRSGHNQRAQIVLLTTTNACLASSRSFLVNET
jgi:hypothetical protein